MSKKQIEVQGQLIRVESNRQQDYLSLTDIARYRDGDRTDYVIQNWLRSRSTIEYLGLWERLNNPDFNPIEFDGIRNGAGLNNFVLTTKQWVDATGAIGLVARPGRYGGTYGHKDIAFEFASWISVEFRLYLILEFQRLKEFENEQLDWDIRRNLAKINYRVHTDAVKDYLIPPDLSATRRRFVYASEADLLNVALFGKTARQWRDEHPDSGGNIRDAATAAQLVCLANLESMNAHLIHEGVDQDERLRRLNQMAIQQMKTLMADGRVEALEAKSRQ